MSDSICVNPDQIDKAVQALVKVVKKQKKNDLTSALEPEVVNLQLAFKKIPSVKNKIIKIPLPNPLVQQTTDVCLFVKDLDKKTRDYEPTVRHYKDMLAAEGINRHIEVIPLKSVKLEYQPHEAKRNLSNMYDVFLADDCIVRLLPGLLGKHFIARKKFPKQVNLKAKDLKKEFNKVLSTEQCVVTGKGSTCQVTIGHTGLSPAQIAENAAAAVEKLSKSIPGGDVNVRTLHLKTISSPALPIYMSLGKREDVTLPKRVRKSKEIEPQEVTTVRNGLVKVTPYGRIEIVRENTEEDLEEEEDEVDEEGDSDSEPVQKKMTRDETKKSKRSKHSDQQPPTKRQKLAKGQKRITQPPKGKVKTVKRGAKGKK